MFIDKFNSLSAIVGLSKDEAATAKFFWYAGVKYALKMNTNVPALLKPKPTKATAEFEHTKRYYTVNSMSKRTDSDVKLTSYEAKLLSLMLPVLLQKVDETKFELKHLKKQLWDKCNPEDASSRHYFDDLNKVKNSLAKLKDQHKTIASVQRKLKKMAKQ